MRFFCEVKSEGFTFQHTRDLPKRVDGVVCLPSRTSKARYRGRGDPKLPDGLDHAEAHFHTAVGVVLAGLRKSGDAVVAVPQDFDTKTVMLLEGTGGEERSESAQRSVLQTGLAKSGVGSGLHLGVRRTHLRPEPLLSS